MVVAQLFSNSQPNRSQGSVGVRPIWDPSCQLPSLAGLALFPAVKLICLPHSRCWVWLINRLPETAWLAHRFLTTGFKGNREQGAGNRDPGAGSQERVTGHVLGRKRIRIRIANYAGDSCCCTGNKFHRVILYFKMGINYCLISLSSEFTHSYYKCFIFVY